MSQAMHRTLHTHSLTVGHLRSRFLSAAPLDEHQVQQWHEAFADQDADDLVGRMVADDEWLLIHRLPLKLRWQRDTAPSEAGRVWVQSLQRAMQAVADEGDVRNVLRYRTWRHGLADLLYRSALGETRRQWAWRQMGLLSRDGLAASEALLQGAHALLAQPELIWPVVHHGLHAEADTGALTALVRRLPLSVWQAWWLAAPQTRGWMAALSSTASWGHEDRAGADTAEVAEATGAPPAAADAADAAAAEGPVLQALLTWAHRHPAQARRLGEVLTVWLAALHGPVASDAGLARRQLRIAREGWGASTASEGAMKARRSARAMPPSSLKTAHDGMSARPGTDQAEAHEALHRNDDAASARAIEPPHTDDLPDAPDLPEPDTLLATRHAGALFWLRHLGDAQVLSALRAADAGEAADMLDDLPTPLHRQALAIALQVPVDDPVMQVMTSHHALQAVPPALQAAADGIVAAWAQWLDAVMPDAPAPRMAWVCQRPGRLKVEPGWIELHLDLDQVDTRIRRLGLDVDPGWVPGLQAVVRIRYA